MRVVIHTGIAGAWGMGHACRSRALAAALGGMGVEVTYLTQTPALVPFVAPVPCRVARQLWTSPATDVLVEDVCFHKPPSWYHRLRAEVAVVRVDAPRATPDTCDLLLAPVAHWDSAVVAALRHTFGPRFLYGWEYVLLEADVTGLPRRRALLDATAPVILCAGGSDPAGVLPTLAAWLDPPPCAAPWRVLLPAYAPTPPCLPPWVTALPFQRGALYDAALLLTTFGVTCYEALYWGIPTLVLPTTKAAAADAERLCVAAGGALQPLLPLDRLTPATFCAPVRALYDAPTDRLRMHAASTGLLDGLGAMRAAQAIVALGKD